MPRQLVGELMDDPDLDPAAHRRALAGLARLNALSAAAAGMWPPILAYARANERPLRLLDAAAGSGDVAIKLCRIARRAGIELRFTACDISPEACAAVERRAQRCGVPVETRTTDILSEPLPAGHDIVINSLFLHHLTTEDTIRALRAMRNATGGLLVISDLVRTRLGLVMAGVASRAMTRSPIVHTDAVRSVRAAWTIPELRALAAEAGLESAAVSRIWPERQRLVWHAGVST